MKNSKTLEVSDDKRLKELQEEFNRQFPFLHLAFYAKSHEEGQASSDKDLLDANLLVKDVRSLHKNGHITIDGNMKVGTFEQLFYQLFGLSVQVYRKSYGKWLQTWATDMWTLNEQNQRGRLLGSK